MKQNEEGVKVSKFGVDIEVNRLLTKKEIKKIEGSV